jgi:hypothetical protein
MRLGRGPQAEKQEIFGAGPLIIDQCGKHICETWKSRDIPILSLLAKWQRIRVHESGIVQLLAVFDIILKEKGNIWQWQRNCIGTDAVRSQAFCVTIERSLYL